MGCNSSKAGGAVVNARKKAKKQVIFGYWDMRGGVRGNSTRYMLEYIGVVYEDKQYPVGGPEWSIIKESGVIPFSNLPYIIDKENGDFKITETLAVQQYICERYKPELLGTTP